MQQTVARPIEFEGIGLHTGKKVRLRIEPGGPDTGIVFVVDGLEIPATAANSRVSARNTELSFGGVTLNTVEHFLSALYAMGVDNAQVVMDSGEPPALDGSAGPVAWEIFRAGLVPLPAGRKFARLSLPLVARDDSGAVVCALPADSFSAIYFLDHQHPKIGVQVARFDGAAQEYLEQIAPARTFGLIEEVEALHKAGLALGGSVENAVVVYPDSYSSSLRFPDEFARHKLLDLIGDIALTGFRLNATLIGCRSGHALNNKLAAMIANPPSLF